MTILNSQLYAKQYKALLAAFIKEDQKAAKDFKLHLDTVIINVATKLHKYRDSIYTDISKVKEIEYRGFIIPFSYNESTQTYVMLAIFKDPSKHN